MWRVCSSVTKFQRLGHSWILHAVSARLHFPFPLLLRPPYFFSFTPLHLRPKRPQIQLDGLCPECCKLSSGISSGRSLLDYLEPSKRTWPRSWFFLSHQKRVWPDRASTLPPIFHGSWRFLWPNLMWAGGTCPRASSPLLAHGYVTVSDGWPGARWRAVGWGIHHDGTSDRASRTCELQVARTRSPRTPSHSRCGRVSTPKRPAKLWATFHQKNHNLHGSRIQYWV